MVVEVEIFSLFLTFNSKVVSKASLKVLIEVVIENNVEDVRQHVQVFGRVGNKMAELRAITSNSAKSAKTYVVLSQIDEQDGSQLRQATNKVNNDIQDDHGVDLPLHRCFFSFFFFQLLLFQLAQLRLVMELVLELLSQVCFDEMNQEDVDDQVEADDHTVVHEIVEKEEHCPSFLQVKHGRV